MIFGIFGTYREFRVRVKVTKIRKGNEQMKTSMLFGAIILSSVLLSACVASEIETKSNVVQASLEENSEIDTTEIKKSVTKEEVIIELSFPYNEIAMYYSNWELSKEGLVPEGDERLKNGLGDFMYENGYSFDKTGRMLGRTYPPNGEPASPTPTQYPAFIWGMASDTEHWVVSLGEIAEYGYIESVGPRINDDITQSKLKRLNEMAQYKTGNEPLDNWVTDSIAKYKKALLTDETKEKFDLYSEATRGVELLIDAIELARLPFKAEKYEIDLTQYKIEATEYTDLGEYVEDIFVNWQEGSEYESITDMETARNMLANAALHYVNYFENDIEDHGLTKEFRELQMTAYEITAHNKARTSSDDKVQYQNEHELLYNEFENQLIHLLEKL